MIAALPATQPTAMSTLNDERWQGKAVSAPLAASEANCPQQGRRQRGRFQRDLRADDEDGLDSDESVMNSTQL